MSRRTCAHHCSANHSAVAAICETLETRRMLAVWNATEGNENVFVQIQGANLVVGYIPSAPGGATYSNPSTLNLTINLLGGDDQINVISNGGATITVNTGSGNNVVHFGSGGGGTPNLSDLPGPTTVNAGSGNDTIYARDFGNPSAATYTITDARFDRPGWGGFFYDGAVDSLILQTTAAFDTVNVRSTYPNQPVLVENRGGVDVINVGNPSQGVQGVRADVSISATAGVNALYVNDTGNATARSANMDWNGAPTSGRVNNLAPAHIIWQVATTTGVNITTGSAADTMLIYANRVPIHLNSAGGADAVLIGDNAVGGAQYIESSITVENSPSYTNLTINNYQDTVNRNWTIDSGASNGFITGMTPGGIYWDNADINAIFLQCGRGVDTGRVMRLSETLAISNAFGGNIDQITFGDPSAGGMQSITQGRAGGVTIDNDPDYTDLIFDDSSDTTARIVTLDMVSGYNELTGLAPATIRFDDNDVKQVTIITGADVDTVNVLRARTNGGKLTIGSWGGTDAVTLGNANSGMQEIIGDVDISNAPSYTALTLHNRADTAARNVTHSATGTGFMQVSGLFPGTLRYREVDVRSVELDGGGGIDSYSISATPVNPQFTAFRLETGAGSDTITIGGAGLPATVDLIEPIILDNALNILDRGRVQLTGSSSSQIFVVKSMLFSGNGTLDIRDKQVILDYTGASPVDAIRSSIADGYSGGAWNGPGITSFTAQTTPGTAVGFAEATDLFSNFPANWLGYSLDNTSILFRHTLNGDANLDRTTNLADFNRLASNFGQPLRRWSTGDFNYDGSANLADFNLLAGLFGSIVSPDGAVSALATHRVAVALLDELADAEA